MREASGIKSQERQMAKVYAVGPMSKIVAAGGGSGLMNLGYASPASASVPLRVRQLNLVQMVFSLLELKAHGSVLDLGCGKGGALALLAVEKPGLRMAGLNVDGQQLLSALGLFERRGMQRRVQLVHADAQSLPFRSGSFDAIYSIELSAHIMDKPAMFSEISRALCPGGRFVMAYLALNREFADYSPDAQEHLRRVASTFHETPESYLTRAEYERLGRENGLEISRSQDLTEGVYPVRHAEMLAALQRIRSRSLWQRLTKLYYHRLRWKVSDQALARFLEIHTARHACRYFEYHLTAWRKRA
jgi:ubiquinone/menaquinone biosynthesis C-methylase UbiE